MYFRYWGRGQADSNNDKAGETEKDECKVEVMDISQDTRTLINLSTWRS